MSIQDIVVLALILVGVLIGLTQGAVKKIFRILIVAVVIALIYYVVTPQLVEWFFSDGLQAMGVESFTMEAGDGTEFVIASIEDMIEWLKTFDIDTSSAESVVRALCEIIIFVPLLIVALPISILVSGLLWHVIVKRFFPKSIRKGKLLSHLIGGVLGGLEWLVVIVFVAAAIGQITYAFENTILQTMIDLNHEYYGIFEGTGFQEYIELFQEYLSMISPTSSDSTILPSILNFLESINLHYLNLFKITIEENGEATSVSFAEGLCDMFNAFIEYVAENYEYFVEEAVDAATDAIISGVTG